jgi:methylmalonyl-CoA mutase
MIRKSDSPAPSAAAGETPRRPGTVDAHGVYRPKHPVRFVTATSLFDGHDASINIIRRLLQATGAEVIHLGHNRSVREVVDAAICEDAQGIAVSAYQGGHVEYFRYMIDLLKGAGRQDVRVYGGGGGVIIPEEIRELHAYGVARIYSPDDGLVLGLQGIINDMVAGADFAPPAGDWTPAIAGLSVRDRGTVARLITAAESMHAAGSDLAVFHARLADRRGARKVPVVGITGTGGAGKSSLVDELVFRFLHDLEGATVAILSVDPTRKKTGGALLGDRIRMNSLDSARVYMRSLATRGSRSEVSQALGEAIAVAGAAGYDVVLVETAGIGQGDAEVVPFADVNLYVMTADYGAASQLEKIEMLDHADLVAINKFERMGSEDALRDVRKQLQRSRMLGTLPAEALPVYGTIAARFNDDGVSALYRGVLEAIEARTGVALPTRTTPTDRRTPSSRDILVPGDRVRYLAEIAQTVRGYKRWAAGQAEAARSVQACAIAALRLRANAQGLAPERAEEIVAGLEREKALAEELLDPRCRALLADWPALVEQYSGDEMTYKVRGRAVHVPLVKESLARTKVRKVVLPKFDDLGERLRWLLLENLPGRYPFTAGVFPFKRTFEDPTRMFAGEGDPFRTNERFRMLSKDYAAKRLSTAFDSVTLYGQDPDERPDIYGKIGTSGVSICTLDDVKVLYSGFELCSPTNSVSMTINGPAPMMLAMFFGAAIDQQAEAFEREHGRAPDAGEREKLRKTVLENVRGTVQADILKEDQGQNTCLFSIDFALKMMGDIQAFFIANRVRNFYSVSISGYHIAEAGANPISQLAFTLANGFTYLEYYRGRGMKIDDFAPNFSFFFSNGMDPEYTVIGRVARRIWAVALRELYGAGERSQMLKYHIQTSGRSLHAQEIQFNDIRTTLQALCAVYDNAQSLHTNSFDEAITTPTPESVRRAVAIQQIIGREWGVAMNENPLQGAFVVEELTELVEEAVLAEFERLTRRGGVLGAMETGYQRGVIQEESLYYEKKKHDGSLPIVGVNTFQNPDAEGGEKVTTIALARATEDEKASQLRRLREFHARHAQESPAALARLKEVVLSGGNVFAELMETVRSCSLGQITRALYEVGGYYRRGM